MSPGQYVVEITRVDYFRSTNPDRKGEEMFCCEFKIVASDNEKHKPGSSAAWTTGFDGFKADKATANVNDLFRSALADYFAKDAINPKSSAAAEIVELFEQAVLEPHLDESKAAAETLKELGIKDPSGCIIGKRVALECTMITTKAGAPFTRHSWSAAA